MSSDATWHLRTIFSDEMNPRDKIKIERLGITELLDSDHEEVISPNTVEGMSLELVIHIVY